MAALRLFSLLAAASIAAVAQDATRYESPPEELPRQVADQPIPFSHKLHSEASIKCTDCHTSAETKERAGLPRHEQCMLCHATIEVDHPDVRKLAALDAGSKIRWERVYRVPDFVFFSHKSHAAANVSCETCHGPIATREVLAQEISTNMVACMNCHADRQANNECFLCHDLGR